jgi:rubrerythrin
VNVTLSALEVFEIAEQIERNGAKFYRRAATLFGDSEVCQLFIKLADWEVEHEQIFRDMGKRMYGSNTASMSCRPESALPDPKVMAGLAIFGIRAEPTEELSGKESLDDILKRAVEKEKDSIVFYNGLKDFLSDPADRAAVDRILTEEMKHIRILHELLDKNAKIRSKRNEKV